MVVEFLGRVGHGRGDAEGEEGVATKRTRRLKIVKLDFSRLGKEFVQGLLAIVGFGALTYVFIIGKVGGDVYIPLVAVMIAFFYKEVKTKR